jgi:hypothetical protein
VITAQSEGGEPADASCPKGLPLAIGGGSVIDEKGGTVSISAPLSGRGLATDGEKPSGWRVRASSGAYTAYAICTRAGSKESGEEEFEEGEEPEEGEGPKGAEVKK